MIFLSKFLLLKLNIIILFLSTIVITSYPNFSYADEYFIVKRISEKSAAKKSISWNLADWMEQKSKFQFWDNWLAMNRSTDIFEAYLGGFYGTSDATTPASSLMGFEGGLYLSLLGVEGRSASIDDSHKSSQAQFVLRLFGSSRQSSHLDVFYGKKDYSREANWEQNYWGSRLTIYIFKNLALSGLYRSYVAADTALVFAELETQGGLLIDLSFLQIFGHVYTETFSDDQVDEGWRAGARLFF